MLHNAHIRMDILNGALILNTTNRNTHWEQTEEVSSLAGHKQASLFVFLWKCSCLVKDCYTTTVWVTDANGGSWRRYVDVSVQSEGEETTCPQMTFQKKISQDCSLSDPDKSRPQLEHNYSTCPTSGRSIFWFNKSQTGQQWSPTVSLLPARFCFQHDWTLT